jgi:hypothetical protein
MKYNKYKDQNLVDTDAQLDEQLDRMKDIMSNLLSKLGIDLDTLGSDKTSPTSVSPTDPKVVGSGWKSCKAWKANGSLNKWGDKIKIDESSSQFKISYTGPSSGLSIAHAANGRDTIHQLYNVLICEMNPFLAKGGMKPNIDGISAQGGKNSDGKSTLTITVPIEKSDETYQIDRRGGWGHDPGASKMSNKCSEIKGKGGKCFGPVKKVVDAKFGKITEYFITHTI